MDDLAIDLPKKKTWRIWTIAMLNKQTSSGTEYEGVSKGGIPKSFFTITILKNMKVSWDDYSQDMESGWWYTYPSEKWWSESQLGVWNSQMESL